jgi:putative Holliday junction resolvase
MRILAVDPGEKRIGTAISDPTGIIANPLNIIQHQSRIKDAELIVQLAKQHDVRKIIVGEALNDEGEETFQSKRANRLAEEIRKLTDIPVEMWDESGSTKVIRATQIEMGVPKLKRRKHIDHLAATYILQTYLDWKQNYQSVIPPENLENNAE